MKDYVIVTDSTVDLPKEYMEEKNVPVLSLSYMMNGETYDDMNGLSDKEFFDQVRAGAMPTTSQITPEQTRQTVEPFLKEGVDVLYLGFSSGLSGSYASARLAIENLKEDYPEATMYAIDSLCASMGEGLLLRKAVALKEAGMGIDELAKWLEENKLHVCHNVTVDDLNHLHRGGRVSKATAVLGTMVKIKPIIYMSNEGRLEVIGKERGRKKSLNYIVERMIEQIGDKENNEILVTHGDCIEDAEYVSGLIKEKLGDVDVLINGIGSVIGSHTGPGVVAVFFMGEYR